MWYIPDYSGDINHPKQYKEHKIMMNKWYWECLSQEAFIDKKRSLYLKKNLWDFKTYSIISTQT